MAQQKPTVHPDDDGSNAHEIPLTEAGLSTWVFNLVVQVLKRKRGLATRLRGRDPDALTSLLANPDPDTLRALVGAAQMARRELEASLTVADLATVTEQELLAHRGFGPKQLVEVHQVLARYGLSLAR